MFFYRRRVQFYETDAQGVVHHSNYAKYFEEARGELLRSLGFPYSKLRGEGFEVVLLSICCEFLKPLIYDEDFCIEINLSHIDRFTFSFQYNLKVGDNMRARGHTKHCITKRGRIVSVPHEVRDLLIQFFSGPYRHLESQR
ncbi:MAG: acyl-CoA thioesterase [Aquificaceae bacterium]|nr:acyl-CoA thioesterase [Aquificaceae bacterium]